MLQSAGRDGPRGRNIFRRSFRASGPQVIRADGLSVSLRLLQAIISAL